MRATVRGVALASVLAVVPAAARAQRSVEFTLATGPALSGWLESSSGTRVGWHLAAGVAHPLGATGFGVRGEVNVTSVPRVGSTRLYPLAGGGSGYPTGSNFQAPGLSLDATWAPVRAAAPLRPYLIAGLDSYFEDAMGRNVQFGGNAGVGLAIEGVGYRLFVEMRFHQVNDGEPARFAPVTLGVRF